MVIIQAIRAITPTRPAIITTTRQRRISLSIVLQSTSQLVERYGREGANTILNGGVASRLFFSGMDIDTAILLATRRPLVLTCVIVEIQY